MQERSLGRIPMLGRHLGNLAPECRLPKQMTWHLPRLWTRSQCVPVYGSSLFFLLLLHHVVGGGGVVLSVVYRSEAFLARRGETKPV